jgi:hypothetical protein
MFDDHASRVWRSTRALSIEGQCWLSNNANKKKILAAPSAALRKMGYAQELTRVRHRPGCMIIDSPILDPMLIIETSTTHKLRCDRRHLQLNVRGSRGIDIILKAGHFTCCMKYRWKNLLKSLCTSIFKMQQLVEVRFTTEGWRICLMTLNLAFFI